MHGGMHTKMHRDNANINGDVRSTLGILFYRFTFKSAFESVILDDSLTTIDYRAEDN